MTDYRFPSPGLDQRFPGGGVDIEAPGGGVDGRFPSPGVDARYQGGYGAGIPENVSLPTISGHPVVGFVLTCDKGGWAGAYPMTFVYSWRSGAIIHPANSETYTVQPADVGELITCVVSATNADGGPIEATSAPVGPAADDIAPTNTVAPVVHNVNGNTTSPVKVGSRLDVVSNGTWTASPPMSTAEPGAAPGFSYQWKRNGVDIAGANGWTYTTQIGDVNQNITCAVTASNGVNPNDSASSNVFGVYSLPVNVTPPLITGSGNDGSADPGEVLQCSTGTWLGVGSNYSYQWRRSVHDNIGSNSNTYVVQEADLTHAIDCVVTKTNEYGPTSEPSSNNYKIGAVLSRSEILLADYANGVAGSFIDEEADADTYLGSMQIKDTVTPANAFLTGGGKLITDKFTFAGQSLRMVEDHDGLIKYGNHNLVRNNSDLSVGSAGGWELQNNATAEYDVGNDHKGRPIADRVIFSQIYGTAKSSCVVTVGQKYLLVLWLFYESGNKNLHFVHESAHSDVAPIFTPMVPLEGNGEWERRTLVVTADAGVINVGPQDRNASGFGSILVANQQLKAYPVQFEDEDVDTTASPVYMPRILFENGVRLGMLAEPQSTNNVPNCTDFEAANWLQQDCTIEATGLPSPVGDKAIRVAIIAASNSYLYCNTPMSGAGVHTGSWWVKGTGQLTVGFYAPNPGEFYKKLVTLTAEWSRLPFTQDVGGQVSQFAIGNIGGDVGVTATEFEICHVQYEAQPVATSPIITGASAVTRLADRMLQSADKWNSDGDTFTLYSKSYPQTLPNAYNSPDPIISIGENAYEHRHLMAFNRPNCYPPDISWDTAAVAGQTLKMASTVDEAAGGKLSVNGGPVKGNASASSPFSSASISLGGNISGSVFINYPIIIEEFMTLRQLISDTELEALSAP